MTEFVNDVQIIATVSNFELIHIPNSLIPKYHFMNCSKFVVCTDSLKNAKLLAVAEYRVAMLAP